MKIIRNNKNSAIKHALTGGALAFMLAALAGFLSQTAVKDITLISMALLLLLMVILTGIIFDIIGVAATATRESALHARASVRLFGAAQAVKLARNAPRVASFCNDVVGDVCGALSGAISVTIVFKMLQNPSEKLSILAITLMTAIVAALVVGGKAFGKSFAVAHGTTIIFRVGQCIAWLDKSSRKRRHHNKEKVKR